MATVMHPHFSRWLTDQMNNREWTQTDLSRKSGLSRQAIANYLDGRTPDYASILTLARVFKTSPESLLRIALELPVQPDEDPWVSETSYKLTRVAPGLRPVISRFIDSMIEDEGRDAAKIKTKTKSKSTRA